MCEQVLCLSTEHFCHERIKSQKPETTGDQREEQTPFSSDATALLAAQLYIYSDSITLTSAALKQTISICENTLSRSGF